jgi:hypothetical protein
MNICFGIFEKSSFLTKLWQAKGENLQLVKLGRLLKILEIFFLQKIVQKIRKLKPKDKIPESFVLL